MIYVEKKTLRIGVIPQKFGTPEGGSFAGFPTDGIIPGGAAAIPRDANGATFGIPGATINNTLDDVANTIQTPNKVHSLGPIVSIEIAPDSPITAAALRIGGDKGDSVHVIGDGARYLGCVDNNAQVQACAVRDLPALARSNAFTGTLDQQIAETVWWDIQAENGPAGLTLQYPLRLNLYRGDQPVFGPSRRAPYYAHLMWKVQDRGGAVASQPGLIVIVDGRKRVRVTAGRRAASGAASIQINGIEGYKSTIDAGLGSDGRLDAPAYDEILAATVLGDARTAPTIFDYGSDALHPYFAIEINIAAAAIGAQGIVTVKAYDD